MKNLHIIYSTFDFSQVKLLAKYGITVEAKYDRFNIEEGEIYLALKPYLDTWKIEEFIISQFSDEDLNAAERLVYAGVWANGYPMPDGDSGYLKTTYDDTDYCKECGVGLIQKEPFRLKKEPNWGNKKMFSLNWVYDELFVRKDFYEAELKQYGIEAKPVLLYKKETIIESTVQLNIPTTTTSLSLDGYGHETCKVCSRKRYDLVNKGFFPAFIDSLSEQHLFKSKEWFGTGANGRKYIFVSAELRKQLLKAKVKANYIPSSR